MLVWFRLKNRLAANPVIKVREAIMRNECPGVNQRPDTIPAHRGMMIRRNGISLLSTNSSLETE
jgi:hypothetical protein